MKFHNFLLINWELKKNHMGSGLGIGLGTGGELNGELDWG